MIKVKREGSQDFDVDSARVIRHIETVHYYFFGIKVYSKTDWFKEDKILSKNKNIGFQ